MTAAIAKKIHDLHTENTALKSALDEAYIDIRTLRSKLDRISKEIDYPAFENTGLGVIRKIINE